ncbi:MAG: HAD family hydrolase [Gammaproteobacteria bacterium]|nr:HAD family hydrolase [Gammaproteobacteria bacterium]
MKEVLQALIFDVDGTLADTERDGHRVAFNLAFQQAGLDWDWSVELYEKLLAVTGGKERIRYYLDNFNTDFQRPEQLDNFIAGLHRSKTDHYTRLLGEGKIPLRPGVERLLREAKDKGLRLAIATTTTPANVQALLINTLGDDSESWFEVIAAGDIVPAKKPAPDIYTYAMEKMNLTPQQCIAFEDSENGIKSSQGAGLATIITTNVYTHDHDFTNAVLVIDNMGEPEQPFNVLAGDKNLVNGSTCLDVDLVTRLFKRRLG